MTPQLQAWSGNDHDPELSCPGLLHELFEARVAARPDGIALIFADQQATYGQLDERANQVARWLQAQGVGPGSFVGLLLPRSPEIFVAMLGILKAGAAYVPVDAAYPADRVAFILASCNAQALVTVTSLAEKSGAFHGARLNFDTDTAALASLPRTKPETTATSNDLAYVIYTSGSTGRPKGVQIEHRSVCQLVRAEGRIFQVRPEDRVYQGFSVAFDASVEEIWLAFFAGAALVIGTQEMIHAGPMLPQFLMQSGVTVFSCVPTLLAMIEEDMPTVRLLILGGEQCPQSLIERWCKAGRRMVNTYGPTEATVIATYGECAPGQPVTIGRPVPNYRAYILDEHLQPVPAGTPGELHLAGVGLSRGYMARPDLTQEKFVPNPFISADATCPRLYKTGDLVRFAADGEIEFLGRIDTQVKIRGFRVELSEIEAVLLQCPGVLAAAVTVREETPGVQQLVGYAVPRDGAVLDEEAIRAQLREHLPTYMVPALVESITTLPVLPSGKVDRNQLPAPRPRAAAATKDSTAPRNDIERKLAASWAKLFAPAPVSLHDDFFLDLGGHSLLAARMVSELRKDPALRELSILDVYQRPTIATLAEKFPAGGEPAEASKPEAPSTPSPVSFGSHFWCGVMQFLSFYFSLGFFSLQWLAPYLTYTWMVEDDYERYEAVLGALGVLTALYPLMLLASILVKWMIIGQYKPGQYPLWGFYYFRWWFVNTIQSAIPVGYLAGTPLLSIYYRLMGAKIGANVHLATDNCAMFDLISIGDDTSIGTDASLMGYTVEDGWLKLGRIDVGRNCYIGTRSVLRENTRLEDDARLEDLSLLTRDAVIPQGETWLGSPARPVTVTASAAREKPPRPSRMKRCAYGALHSLGVLIFPVFVLAAVFPGMMLMNHLNYEDDYYWYLMLAPLVAISFVVFLCLEIAAVKWLLLGRVQAGRYPLYSSFYFRKWFVDQLMELSLDFLGPLYASIYLAPWYRLLGAKLGVRAEISTASFISPDLLAIDDESFIADSVSLGAARVEHNELTVAGNRIGKRSFIGNSAMLPPGTIIGDNCLIGCLSVPPGNPADAARPDATWLGSPAIFLPQRQVSTAFSAESTFKPNLKLRMLRAAIEFIRVILPSSGFIILTSLLFSVVVLIQEDIYLEQMLLLFPFLYAGCGLIASLFTIAMKWILMGRYRACEKPLWSTFVWRTELVNALQEHLANDFMISLLTGTPFICWYYRLLGAKIGKRVYLETTDLTEYDLVKIGDEATLNADCTIQTHLFEDRVMKMAPVEIGPRANVGCLALVLYDTRIEEGASLNDLSLLMKGETLPAHTAWEGIPARPKSTTTK